jgi:malonyl-CoA decarboxylase
LGNFLIKQVVADLKSELPKLKTFSTLSPVPGFVKWLRATAYADEDVPIRETAMRICEQLDQSEQESGQVLKEKLQSPLKKMCAHYLVSAKSRDGSVLNPVARFHLGNGAILERINWRGDTSIKGVTESASLMVNYLYDIRTIESNHEAFVKNGEVISSNQVKSLLK